ncbi:TPA: 50S ribosomal protein L24e [Candidatus Bathyarchaeota archaeon]|nr:50S ribosomal protein L24e [Candidatus Bathyarchaeota archaeon]
MAQATRVCSFCGYAVTPGTGLIFVRKDGTVLRFCSRKCRISMLVHRRDPRRLKWTKLYQPGVKRRRRR